MLKKVVFIAAAAAAVCLLVDHLVVTERERLEAFIERGVAAVEAGDAAAVEKMVAADYRFQGRSRPAFLRLCRGVLEKFAPMKVRVLDQGIRLPACALHADREEEGRASARLSAVVTPRPGSEWPGPVRTEWELHFEKEGDTWKVSGVRPLWR